MTASERFRTLAVAPDSELGRVFRAGRRLELQDVAGTTWRGWNRHRLFAMVRQRKFFKLFQPARSGGRGEGENVLARQDGLERPWQPRFSARGFFPFAVLPPGAGPIPDAPSHALVISYGDHPDRGPLNPASLVIDHLVRVPGAESLLLGRSVVRMPRKGAWFLEYFLLEA